MGSEFAKNGMLDYGMERYPVGSNGGVLIALEAWRRGLRVDIRERGYTVSSQHTVLPFRLTRLATPEVIKAVRICNSKHLTKEHFIKAGIPTPGGVLFHHPFSEQEILKAAADIGYPVCLKANGWSKGKGVYSKVEDSEKFWRYFKILTEELKCREIVIEKHAAGDDFRFFVVGDKVAAVVRRVPANVTGDGSSTINQLIAQKKRTSAGKPLSQGSIDYG